MAGSSKHPEIDIRERLAAQGIDMSHMVDTAKAKREELTNQLIEVQALRQGLGERRKQLQNALEECSADENILRIRERQLKADLDDLDPRKRSKVQRRKPGNAKPDTASEAATDSDDSSTPPVASLSRARRPGGRRMHG